MRHPFVVLGLTFQVNRCPLARATGLFPSNGSFCLVQRGRPGKPSRERSLLDPTQSAECLLHCELGDVGNHLEHVAIRTAVKVVTLGQSDTHTDANAPLETMDETMDDTKDPGSLQQRSDSAAEPEDAAAVSMGETTDGGLVAATRNTKHKTNHKGKPDADFGTLNQQRNEMQAKKYTADKTDNRSGGNTDGMATSGGVVFS